MHIWEHEHPYHCADGNYHSNDWSFNFASWSDFMGEWGEADEDYNFVIRWDWKRDGPSGDGTLQICYVLQRKGCYAACHVRVTAKDEPAVVDWLKTKAEYVRRVWAPLL